MSCRGISGQIILEGGIAKAQTTREETWPLVLRTMKYRKEEKRGEVRVEQEMSSWRTL